MPAVELNPEPLFELNVSLKRDVEVIGPAPEGLRTNLYVEGGELVGPHLRGALRPSGGDWFVLRRDGVGVVDVRCTLEIAGGALIYGEHHGFLEFGESGYESMLRGERPASVEGRVSARYHTGDPRYAWLNRRVCAGTIAVDLERREVRYRIYAL